MKYNQLFKSIVLLILFSVSANAQGVDSSSNNHGLPLRVSFFGDNMVHPGLRIGTSYILHEKVKVRTRKSNARQERSGSKTKVIQYKLDGNLGYYSHPNNHSGLIVGLGITRHRNKNESWFSTAWSFEINYLRRFYNIETFEIDENGAIKKLGSAGNGGLMFALAPSMERKISEKGPIVFFKPALQLVKYNHLYLPNAAIELGMSLKLTK